MSTPKKVITFETINPIISGTYTISFETNGTGIFVAIHDKINKNTTVEETTFPPFKQFGFTLNQGNVPSEQISLAPITEEDVIIQKLSAGNNNAIYQFSVEFAKFIKGDNTLTLYEIFPPGGSFRQVVEQCNRQH